jgi:hypothetical protein
MAQDVVDRANRPPERETIRAELAATRAAFYHLLGPPRAAAPRAGCRRERVGAWTP